MRRILVRLEHLHRVTEYTKRMKEVLLSMNECDSKDEYKKLERARVELDKEIWGYLTPRYNLREPSRALTEHGAGEFFILSGNESEIRKVSTTKKGELPLWVDRLEPDFPLELD
jgi:hypothetical protein